MSTLIVQLPAQPRLAAQRTQESAEAPLPEELAYVFSPDGVHLGNQGLAPVNQLPEAQHLIAVVAPADIGWHRVTLPKAPASRLRQALAGLLEEALLEEESELHLAVEPGVAAGRPAWIGALSKPWLSGMLARLEQNGRSVDRVVPAWTPDGPVAGHVFNAATGLQLAWRDADGPLCLPLDCPATRSLLARQPADADIDWSSCPEGATEAAHLAGRPVGAQSDAQALLDAASSGWNLRQFDLAPQRRGQRAAQDAWLQFWQGPTWRATRIGLLALLILQLAGANLWAWQQRRALEQRRQAMVTLLQTTFPQVRAVIDAPAQMQKEIDLLRATAGRPGDTDLEPLLYAAQAAWPPSRGPANGLHFEAGRLTLDSPGWSPPEMDAFRSRLGPMGLDAEAGPGGPQVMRARPGTSSPPSPLSPSLTKAAE